MTREDIVRMARQVGYPIHHPEWQKATEEFAALVVAAERNSWPAEMEAMERQVNILTDALAQAKAEEREACAKVCDRVGYDHEVQQGAELAFDLAAAIRARGQA